MAVLANGRPAAKQMGDLAQAPLHSNFQQRWSGAWIVAGEPIDCSVEASQRPRTDAGGFRLPGQLSRLDRIVAQRLQERGIAELHRAGGYLCWGRDAGCWRHSPKALPVVPLVTDETEHGPQHPAGGKHLFTLLNEARARPQDAALDGTHRDRIPELAAANGHPGSFEQATGAEFALLLRAKLLEEAQEVATASPATLLEELGDVLQVLYALANQAGYSAAEVECARVRKARTHGTYTRRLVWQPPPEREQGRDTRSRRQAEPRAHPAPHPTEATR